jgi:hypothetical protein
MLIYSNLSCMQVRLTWLLSLLSLSAMAQIAHPKAAFHSSVFQFVENKGQYPAGVLFRAEIPGGYLFVGKNALHYAFYDTDAVRSHHPGTASTASRPAENNFIKAHGVSVFFEGVNPDALPEGREREGSVKNFFIGNDPQQWATEVKTFTEIICPEIYPGISLRIYTRFHTLKYEFLVQPGADPSRIRMRYAGAENLSLHEGNLLIKTSLCTLVETQPYSFQNVGGSEKKVDSRFQLKDSTVRFVFPQHYDRRQPLTIDPTLIFSTFSGSFADNWGFTATYDSSGNLYSGGIVLDNLKFPVTPGAFQVSFGGAIDVAILKFSKDGKQLLYASYLGGSAADVPHSLIVNKNQELLIMGTTGSANFPLPAGAVYDRTFNGGSFTEPLSGIAYSSGSDMFVARLSPDGSRLLAATYLGGNGNDGLNPAGGFTQANYGDQFRGEIALDTSGNVYVASSTTSTDFPIQNAPQPTLSGLQDGFITQFNPDLSNVLWSTYLGGSQTDAIYGMKISLGGNLYVCGTTRSTNLPVTPGVIKTGFSGVDDGFVGLYHNNILQRLTYLGTSASDQAFLLDLDPQENIVVMGTTFGNYPVTSGVYHNGNSGGQFIHSLRPDLSATNFSTVVGSGRGTPDISPTAFLVNDCSNIYIAGWGGIINQQRGVYSSSTSGLPVTANAFKGTTTGDDFYFMILEKEAKSLLFGSFFGETNSPAGNHVDGGTCRFDKKGVIYHVACACRGSSNFPQTPGGYSSRNNSTNCNADAFKIDLEPANARFNATDSVGNILPPCLTAPARVRFANTSTGADRYEWSIDQFKNSASVNEEFVFTQDGIYTVTLRAYSKLSCKPSEVKQTLKVTLATFAVSPDIAICPGDTAQLLASGGMNYKWSPTGGLSASDIPNPRAFPKDSTRYTVTITNKNGCVGVRSVSVKVGKVKADFKAALTSSECDATPILQITNLSENAVRYEWSFGDTTDVVTEKDPAARTYRYPGSYTLTLTAYDPIGCKSVKTLPLKLGIPFRPPNVITPNSDTLNTHFVLPEEGWKLEIFNRWGKTLFITDDYRNNWGKEAEVGLYFYNVITSDGRNCKGWLQVLK